MNSNALLTFLLNAIWQIPLIALVAYICDYFLMQTNARIRHAFWALTLILCLGLPICSIFKFSSINSFGTPPVENSNIQQINNSEFQAIFSKSFGNETNPVLTISENLSLFLFGCYALFTFYSLIKFFKVWKRTQALVKTAFITDLSEDILSVAEECQEHFDVKEVRILFSNSNALPFTVGFFRPLIVLPVEFAQEKDRNLLLSAIGHELAHIKRHDYLLKLICEIICLPLSFHPVATLVKRRIKETCELSCDELVIDKLLKPSIYAQSLVQLANSALDLGRKATMTVGINDADILENRIMKILKRPKITAKRKNLLLISASVFFVVAFLIVSTFTISPVIAQQSTSQAEKQKAEAEAEKLEAKKLVDEKQETENASSEEQIAKRKAEQEMMNLSQSDLAKKVTVSMTQAIETVTKQESGTVLECKLVFVKEGQSDAAYYAVKISKDEGEKLLLVNALDGKIQ